MGHKLCPKTMTAGGHRCLTVKRFFILCISLVMNVALIRREMKRVIPEERGVIFLSRSISN